jgi:hypothetical protein
MSRTSRPEVTELAAGFDLFFLGFQLHGGDEVDGLGQGLVTLGQLFQSFVDVHRTHFPRGRVKNVPDSNYRL